MAVRSFILVFSLKLKASHSYSDRFVSYIITFYRLVPVGRVNIVDDGNYIDPYFRGMEPGIRFFPLDQELVVEYLMKKIRNEPLPKNRIHEVNIYEYHPQTLAG